ncbi:MAG: hypothetical protein IMZ67_07200, partial [Acidobacteria bacterium]|nr:hypothetical protein [Acidobacteriota bacterium]
MKTICSAVAATVGACLLLGAASAPPVPARAHPRMLVSDTDPFSGIPALKAKLASGERPSDDLPGWALSWLLTGDETVARRAVEALRRTHLPTSGGSNQYLDYVRQALAFDWLYTWPG